jgi:serine/threonine protein kinase
MLELTPERSDATDQTTPPVDRPGSSIVQLVVPPDERPTVITRATVSVPTVETGTVIGPYEVLEPIGRGGMASVFKSRDRDLGRIVALKILPPEWAADADAVSRFKQEGRAAARLDHDGIARIYACGEDAGRHYIAFEFIEGEDLRKVLNRETRLAPEMAIEYLIQVTAGLKHAAERGVVHRDIKPANILISPDGHA